MSRARSTNRSKALKLWLKSGKTMMLKDIAAELGVSDVLIRKWKFLDNWDEVPDKRPRGAQPGNKNAVGNKGGPGGPPGNEKALKHGLYKKFLPQSEEYQELMQIVQEMDPIDMLWQGVEVAFTKLLWAQRIMFVKDKDDMTKEIKKTETYSDDNMTNEKQEWEIQFAWDKQAVDIRAYSTISREFRSAMKQFLTAAPENDERRLKLTMMESQIEKTKAEVEKIKGGGKNPEAGNWAEALQEVAKRRKDAKGEQS